MLVNPPSTYASPWGENGSLPSAQASRTAAVEPPSDSQSEGTMIPPASAYVGRRPRCSRSKGWKSLGIAADASKQRCSLALELKREKRTLVPVRQCVALRNSDCPAVTRATTSSDTANSPSPASAFARALKLSPRQPALLAKSLTRECGRSAHTAAARAPPEAPANMEMRCAHRLSPARSTCATPSCEETEHAHRRAWHSRHSVAGARIPDVHAPLRT